MTGVRDLSDPISGRLQLGILDHYIGFHLRLAQNASFRAFARTIEEKLRPEWFVILSLIHSNPGITPMLLSRASGRDKSTLTPILRNLTHHRLIERRPVPGDRRSYALSLTPAGREKLRELAARAEIHEDKLDRIAGTKKAELLALLQRLSTMLD